MHVTVVRAHFLGMTPAEFNTRRRPALKRGGCATASRRCGQSRQGRQHSPASDGTHRVADAEVPGEPLANPYVATNPALQRGA
jgi:hypothetical protein